MERFERPVHRRFPGDKFIVFPELQQRGALHFHFPISRWMPRQELRYYHDGWRKASGTRGGTFNVRWHRGAGVSDAQDAVRICNDLNVGKHLGMTRRELGEQRYRASKDIRPPRVKYLMGCTDA